jgi:hypothetical protein
LHFFLDIHIVFWKKKGLKKMRKRDCCISQSLLGWRIRFYDRSCHLYYLQLAHHPHHQHAVDLNELHHLFVAVFVGMDHCLAEIGRKIHTVVGHHNIADTTDNKPVVALV